MMVAALFTSKDALTYLKGFIVIALILNGALWFSVRYEQPRWTNIPPAPSMISAVMPALGDTQLAYRAITLSLQNFGYVGGRETNLKEYDYEALRGWLMLQHSLDPLSNATPTLAGFMFGANKDSDQLGPIVDYLELAGAVDAPQKWRWLVQAIFIARHKMQDYDRAYEIASKLAAINDPDMPAWTKQMRAFVRNNQGEKQAALGLMLELLNSEGETMHPSDINAIKGYVCEQISTPEEAQTYPLCQGDF
jgi:hypothetical protein